MTYQQRLMTLEGRYLGGLTPISMHRPKPTYMTLYLNEKVNLPI